MTTMLIAFICVILGGIILYFVGRVAWNFLQFICFVTEWHTTYYCAKCEKEISKTDALYGQSCPRCGIGFPEHTCGMEYFTRTRRLTRKGWEYK